MERRAEFIAGVRALAAWLEVNPQVPAPGDRRFLLALLTNGAVEAFAAEHGLRVCYDEEGNASCRVIFGPVCYRAYGYVDFQAHCERSEKRDAEQYATRHGLQLVPAHKAQ